MSLDDSVFKTILDQFLNQNNLNAEYLQYHHKNTCTTPCNDCPERDKRTYKNGEHTRLPVHPHCDCYYTNVETKPLGSISQRQPSPDVWLKLYEKLPNYYITKEEAEKLGWQRGKDLSLFAPEKMIGGGLYENRLHILPEKEGRIWKECDINYESGKRNSLRLFYSNDGLMFFSPDHLYGNVTVYQIK